jgi:nucleoside-diphosphate-sugar epimerase
VLQEKLQLATPGPVLVLGGSGFIGSRLVMRLRENTMPVHIGDLRPSEEFHGIWSRCDVRDPDSLRALFANVRAVVNLAAEHRDDVRPISRYHETNVEGAVKVCQVARQCGVSKLIFTSSAAVYGFHPQPVGEEGPFLPFNPYGETKLKAESVYAAWAREDPSRTLVIVRPTVVFGEGNRGNVYNLLHQIATGKFIMVGSGDNVKSMAYVGNVADFLIYALSLEQGAYVFNYVDGPDMSMQALVDHVTCCLNHANKKYLRIPKSLALAGGHMIDGWARVTRKSLPISAVRIRKFCENTQFKAERLARSGFRAHYSLSEGLARTIDFEFRAKRS